MLTQELVRELFDYNPLTGDLIWRVSIRGRFVRPGATAGHVGRYVAITVDGRRYPAHHLVWLWHYGYIPDEIDHRNRIKIDNRIENLRDCTRQQNTGNVGLRSTNTSGYRGVWFANYCGRWRASVKVDAVAIHLGYYDTPEQAALAYNEAARQHFGEFAYLNEVAQ